MNFKHLLLTLTLILLTACTRNTPVPSVTLRLDGGSMRLSESLPANRLACYGVDVAGDGIPASSANACSPPTSAFAGFNADTGNTQFALSVPKGSNRTVRVVLYLAPTGATTCPKITTVADVGTLDPNDLYVVGQANGVSTAADVELTINAVFPGLAASIASDLNLPGCGSAAPAVTVTSPILSLPKLGVAVIGLSLAQAATTATAIDFTTLNGTAVAGVDFIGGAGRVTIPAGQTVGRIVIPLFSTHGATGALGFKVQVNGSATLATVNLVDTAPPARTNWSKISSVEDHVCALNALGAMYCWGYNNQGYLGDGSTDDRPTPTPVVGLGSGVIAASAGNSGSCAIMSDGTARCWGSNSYGQLGDGTNSDSNVPVNVTGLSGVTSIQRGSLHSCALTSAGEVKCWGMNTYGQLGDGTATDSLTPVTPLGLGSGVTQLSVNFHGACALLSTGALKCWGLNNLGQLGVGNVNFAINIPTSIAANVQQVAQGAYFGCAIVGGGSVTCWGQNGSGSLGNGTTTDSTLPVNVNALTTATQITVGGYQACARLSSGSIYCWGSNTDGQIAPTTASFYDTPVLMPAFANAVQLAIGSSHICALFANGTIKCQGGNYHGQLGLGESTVDRFTPTLHPTLNTAAISAIDGGGYYSRHYCAVRAGAALCWGNNSSGQLGDGTLTDHLTPSTVSGLSSGVADLSVAEGFSCARTTGGSVNCWGSNANGRLGDGTDTTRSTPVGVGLATTAAQIAVGSNGACARLIDKSVQCWGWNTYGQLGDSTNTTSFTPVTVGVSDVTQIAAGAESRCALRTNGDVYCWGFNGSGQLGDGTNVDRSAPVLVTGLGSPASRISVGGDFACAVLVGGNVKCWGGNASGQLGNGTTTSSLTPVAVVAPVGGKLVGDVATGSMHACRIFTDGTMQCWGSNSNGQLGSGLASSSPSPVTVTGMNGVVRARASLNNTCAITETGAAFCWGSNKFSEIDLYPTNVPRLVVGP